MECNPDVTVNVVYSWTLGVIFLKSFLLLYLLYSNPELFPLLLLFQKQETKVSLWKRLESKAGAVKSETFFGEGVLPPHRLVINTPFCQN